jgi:predicted XRE-type DNA-binding protein
MTEWRTIPGQEGRYAVSDAGEVMSMNFKGSGLPGVLKPGLCRGYATVEIGADKRYTVHRLVAAAFIGPRPDGMQINHKNGNKADNRLENIEYCTQSENMKHAFATGLQNNQGERHSQAKLTEEKVMQIRKLLGLGFRQGELAELMGVSQSAISRVKNGNRWTHVNMAAAGESLSAVV